jgi:hypothetical protein
VKEGSIRMHLLIPSFCKIFYWCLWAGIAQSVQRLTTGWTVRGSNPGGGEIFLTRPDRTWGPHSLLYNGYRVFSVGKAAGAWRWPPTPSSAEVKERVELYLYFPLGLCGRSRVSFTFTFSCVLTCLTMAWDRTKTRSIHILAQLHCK